MAEKQAHLNGSYYGPSIPPSKSYHRPSRGGGCGAFGCGCCILSLLLKIVLTAVFIAGLAVFIFWLIFRPNMVKFHVTDASLTEFNLTANNTLHYNLALNMTIRNPNKKIGIYYDRIEARAFYEDKRFGLDNNLAPFYQGHKNTSTLSPVFRGQQVVLVDAKEVSEFSSEKNAGVYSIDVKLYLRVRFKLGRIKTNRFRPRIECDLKVPFSSNGGSTGSFETSKCDFELDF